MEIFVNHKCNISLQNLMDEQLLRPTFSLHASGWCPHCNLVFLVLLLREGIDTFIIFFHNTESRVSFENEVADAKKKLGEYQFVELVS